ncbi:fibroleukin-like [Mercenaria mercenaria]|uniref:fibroleukin-like n=1 Tax=Mercenaria mercenaria TaxID=6596 RepID=UPI00234E65B9|nr:fibroleukin-like [Mercenaria mercenaria]
MRLCMIKTVLFILLQIIKICSSSSKIDSKLVIERIKYLETRINTEAKFRDADYAVVIDRLDEIDKKLNESLVQGDGFDNEDQEASDESNSEIIEHLKEDFTRIRKAFREEKSETARIRREIPQIENDINSVKEVVDKYCMANTNKTEEILWRLEEYGDKIDTVGKEIVEQGVNNTEAIANTINLDNSKAFEITQIVQRNAENIAKIEDALRNLSSNLAHLFIYGPKYSCKEFRLNGALQNRVYKQYNGLDVFCDQTTDGGGWTVFQRRQNGETDFYRNWTEYKNGFGDLTGEFWLGNEHLSILTSSGDHELRIDMEDFDGNKAYAKYSKFMVYPEEDKYKLEVSGYSGNAGDSLEYHNGMAFTTFDNDNDKHSSRNCAIYGHGAWWYNACHHSNLNGQYFNIPGKRDHRGIIWFYWKNKDYSLKSVEMKFR